MTGRFEIVRGTGTQAWHVREVGGNGEKVWTTETYAKRDSAERALCRLAERFGWRDVGISWDDDDRVTGLLCSAYEVRVAEVRMVDEREVAS